MIHIDILSAYLISGTSSLAGAAVLRLAASDDARTRRGLRGMVWGLLMMGVTLTPAGLGADSELAVAQISISLGTLMGLLLFGRGVAQMQGRNGWSAMAIHAAVCAVACLSVLWLDRLVFGKLFAAAMALTSTWMAWQARGLIVKPRERSERLFGLAVASLAPTVWLRLALTLRYEGAPRTDLMYAPEPFATFFGLVYCVLPMIAATLLLNVLNARLHLRLRELASTDELTGLMTRRALRELSPVLVQHEQRRDREVALLMLDIDHFKRINDQFGHPMGDAVLKQVALALRSQLRPDALLARYGGEEFVAVVPVDSLPTARRVAERLREAIASLDWRGLLSLPGGVTVSVGVSMLGRGEELDAGMKRADEALYRAKHEGRNQCQVSLAVA